MYTNKHDVEAGNFQFKKKTGLLKLEKACSPMYLLYFR